MAVPGVEVIGPLRERYDEVLTPEALGFLAELHRAFDGRRRELLARRDARAVELAAGATLDFLDETKDVREGDWRVAARRPAWSTGGSRSPGRPTRKMTDQRAQLRGQGVAGRPRGRQHPALGERDRRASSTCATPSPARSSFTSPEGKRYAVTARQQPTIVCPPAGLAPAGEAHPGRRRAALGQPGRLRAVSSSTAPRRCSTRGSGPYFYLPKLESHLEARLWNDVFVLAEERLGLPRGTIRATVLIETIPAAFEMDEILYELREHSAGLNAGRWDYMFSVIKKFRTRGRELPAARPQRGHHDGAVHARLHRAAGADLPPARRARHRRHGGLHPQPRATRRSTTGRAGQGPRGQDSARPATASTAPGWPTPTWCRSAGRSSTGCSATGRNQLDRQRDDVAGRPPPSCSTSPARRARRTEEGLRNDVSVGIQYLAAWLRGTGAVAIFNLMEDAATAEISRSQVWQWLHNDVTLDDTGPDGHRASWSSRSPTRRSRKLGGEPGGRTTRPGRCSWRSPWPTSSSTS